MSAAAPGATTAVWHDVECAAYEVDLPLWERLAAERGSPVLDLGCGTGRVALHLARRGHRVRALDIDPQLVAVLEERASGEQLDVDPAVADIRALSEPAGVYPLVIVAMQLIQMLEGRAERLAALRGIAATLRPGGLAALAIVDDPGVVVGEASSNTVPDVREVNGWVHSSLPLEVVEDDGRIAVRRLRQLVSPAGELSESQHIDSLDVLDVPALVAESEAAGLLTAGVERIADSELHVGSAVVLLERQG